MKHGFLLFRAGMVLLIVLANLGAHPSAPRVKFAGFLDVDAAMPGQQVRVVFEVELPSGFHVNSNAPLDEFLKPTRLEIATPDGVTINELVYPEPLLFKASFSETPIAVYEHRFLIGASMDLSHNLAHGNHPLTATLKYQACTDRVCYPPAKRTASIALRVAAESIPAHSDFAQRFAAVRFAETHAD